MRRLLFAVLGMVCLVSPASGQATAPTLDQTELVKSLLERIDKLEKRVGELESSQACLSRTCEPNAPVLTASAVGPRLVPAQEAPKAAPQTVYHDHENAAPAQEQATFPSCRFGDLEMSIFRQPINRALRADLISANLCCI
jgi:hypothetical protein